MIRRPEPADAAHRPLRARFVTFGCKVNQYDTEVLRERALASGYRESEESADLIVVNTCTVTEHGGAEARKAVRRLARENPAARIYVTGCYAVSDPEAAGALPNVAAVVSNDDKSELLSLLGGEADGTPFIEQTVGGFRDHTRAFVKVEDGCHLRCTFCIIPAVRPAVTSKRPATVVEEVRGLVRAGHREVVLTGVHLGAYGRDGGAAGDRDALGRLVTRILGETEVERLRLSSVEANEVTPQLIDVYAREGRLAPHLHLPLQSGSADVLARMRRRYDPDRFLASVRRVRRALPDAALSTDVIVGFPGETGDDFEATLALMREARFVKTHVFPYSRRRGTPAAGMRDQVPSREIRRRVHAADEEGRRLAAEYARGRLGAVARVLVESRRRRGWLTGVSGRYLRVLLKGRDDLMNRILPVRLTALAPDGVRGEVLS